MACREKLPRFPRWLTGVTVLGLSFLAWAIFSGKELDAAGDTHSISTENQQEHARDDGHARRKRTPESGLCNGIIALPDGEQIELRVACTAQTRQKGLSGVFPDEFSGRQGMLFFYRRTEKRSFWMPDTYMDLDIFFLDENLQVVAIHRNLPAHPGMSEPPPIARTRKIRCRHVLEMRADSPLADHIRKGMRLHWVMPPEPMSSSQP